MLNTLQVRDYMIRDPFLLSPSMSVTDAIAVLLAQGLAGAPVVEQGRLVEPAGGETVSTGGRPAALYRFRRDVMGERPAPGLRLGGRS